MHVGFDWIGLAGLGNDHNGGDQLNLSEGESSPCKLDEPVPQVSKLSHCLMITNDHFSVFYLHDHHHHHHHEDNLKASASD